MILKKLFRRKKSQTSDPIYKIIDVDVTQLSQFSDGLDQIQAGEIDGFIIRNVIKQDELQTLIKSHDQIADDQKYFSDTGMIVFPPPFSNVDKSLPSYSEDLKNFFITAASRWDNFPSDFGFDFEDFLDLF